MLSKRKIFGVFGNAFTDLMLFSIFFIKSSYLSSLILNFLSFAVIFTELIFYTTLIFNYIYTFTYILLYKYSKNNNEKQKNNKKYPLLYT